MASIRKRIRHTLRDALLAAGTAAGTRVETNRSSRVWRGKLPALVIYTLDDGAEEFGESPKSYSRSLRVTVEVWTTKSAAEEEDDALDDLVDQVEDVLLPLIPLITQAVEGNVGMSGYEGVQTGFDSDGERILAGARLTFRFHYYTEPSYIPSDGLAPFTLAHVEHDLEGGDPIDATDDISLPQ